MIWRQISKTDNVGQSKWKINGKSVTQDKVKDTIAALNVQVDNLCQFLPQDKVASFSSLDGCSLLQTTERALERADSKPLEMHLKLAELKKELQVSLRAAESLREQVTALDLLQANAQRDVLRFKERERLVDEVVWLKKKLPWMKFESLRQATKELQEACKLHEAERDDLKQRLKPFEERIADAQAAHREAEAAVRPLRERAAATAQQTQKAKAAYDRLVEDYTRLKDKREKLASEMALREARVKQCERALATARTALADFEDAAPALKERVAAATAAAAGAEQAIEQAGQKKAQLSGERRRLSDRIQQKQRELAELTSRQRQRLQALARSRDADAVLGAYHFIQNPVNASVFKKPILGPICLLADVADARFVVQVESSIPSSTWTAFVVQCPEDRQALRSRFNVNVFYTTQQFERRHPVDDADRARLRIDKWIDELIEVDPIVMNALLDVNKIGGMAVCLADADIEAVSNAGVNYFFVGQSQVTANRSRYGDKLLTLKVRDMHGARARILTAGGNADAERELHSEIDMIKTELEALGERAHAIDDEENRAKQLLSSLRSHQSALQHNRGEIERQKRKVTSCEEALHEAQSAVHGNVDEMREQCTRLIVEVNNKRLKAVRVWVDAVETLAVQQREHDAADLKREAMAARLAAVRNLSKSLRAQLVQLEEKLIVSRAEYEERKKLTKQAKATAEQECPLSAEVRE